MNNKKLIFIIGALILLLIVYHVLTSHEEPKSPPVTPAKPVSPKPNVATPAASPVANQDQQQIDTYTAAIAAGKTENGDAYFQRGLLYLKLKQSANAIADFTKALQIAPKQPYLLYNRALAYQQNGQLDNALADLNAAIEIKPDFVDAYNTRGLIYVDQQDFNGALTDYQQAIKLNPKFDDAYFNLGTLYERQKKYDDAKKAFTDAINNNQPAANAKPEDVAQAKHNLGQAYLNRANVEMELGDYKSALIDANYVVTNYPQSIEALRMRASVYQNMGNVAAATADNAAADSLGMQNMLNQKQ